MFTYFKMSFLTSTAYFQPIAPYVSLLEVRISANNLFHLIDDVDYAFEYYGIYEFECVVFTQKKLSGHAKKFLCEIQSNSNSFGKKQLKLGLKWNTCFKPSYLNMEVKTTQLGLLCEKPNN